MTAQDITDLINQVEAASAEMIEPKFYGTKEVIDFVRNNTHILDEMEAVIIPKRFNINGEYDNKFYLIPTQEILPINFEMGET